MTAGPFQTRDALWAILTVLVAILSVVFLTLVVLKIVRNAF